MGNKGAKGASGDKLKTEFTSEEKAKYMEKYGCTIGQSLCDSRGAAADLACANNQRFVWSYIYFPQQIHLFPLVV